MKKVRFALFQSIVALLLCLTILTGNTFAWFSDSVSSTVNHITAENLDVELQYSKDFASWNTVTEATNIFAQTDWEPGHTEVVYLKVVNAGNLALKYQLGLNIVDEKGSVNQAGSAFVLSDYIRFGVVEDVTAAYADRSAARLAVRSSQAISTGYQSSGSILNGGADRLVALVVYMPEEVGNAANHATGVAAPQITLGLNVYATQEMAELDSFDNTYDSSASLPLENLHMNLQMPVSSDLISADNTLTAAVTVGYAEGGIFAEIPADVKLADGANSLTLSVNTMAESQANVTLVEGEVATPIDVHVEGIAADNTQPMLITLNGLFAPGLNEGNYKLYHVENGVTQEMTCVANPVNHNEYSYDASTGNVRMMMASFSEVLVVSNATNYWDGTATDRFEGGSGTEADPFIIANAQQLAYFRNLVDGGNTFAGQYVKLGANICLASNPANGEPISFDPIGWGYDRASYNAGGAEGKTFKGTFDGGNNYIFGLYQNGWDLGYVKTNCGIGLFASATNAKFQNLTITGADIRVETVEAGVLVGLAQGNCTFENIKIYGCTIANYQKPAGGVVGEVSPAFQNGEAVDSTHTFKNVTVDNNTTVGSMWGDFDAPLGGVIGAYWDDYSKTKVVMDGCHIGCVMDAYSDVTSAYQWYAYRRAGMLIGNSDRSTTNENGRTVATAPYLTCDDVHIYYGDWINYHYCQFTNQDNAWCNNYPWVRVEEGKYCSAYSNPRYGCPVIEGVAVTNDDHECTATHSLTIPFGQLYGGGQGVYGGGQEVKDHYDDAISYETNHEGVTIEGQKYIITMMSDDYVVNCHVVADGTAAPDFNGKDFNTYRLEKDDQAFAGWVDERGNPVTSATFGNLTQNTTIYAKWSDFTVTYMDREEIYAVVGVDKGQTYTVGTGIPNPTRTDVTTSFKAWVNAAGIEVGTITVSQNITVYDSWHDIYTARFVHQTGRVLEEQEFTKPTASQVTAPTMSDLYIDGVDKPFKPVWGYFDGNTWKTDWQSKLSNATADVTIHQAYEYEGQLGFTPVDNNPRDGVIEEYKLTAMKNITLTEVVIPGEIDGVKVTTIVKLHDNGGTWNDWNDKIVTIKLGEGVVELQKNSLAYTTALKTVYLPSTLKKIDKNAFARNTSRDDNKKITIEFNGTMEEWDAVSKDGDWHNGLGTGTRVNCTDGYFELKATEILFGAYESYEWTKHPNN